MYSVKQLQYNNTLLSEVCVAMRASCVPLLALSQLGNSLKLKFNPEFDYLVQLVFVQRFPSLSPSLGPSLANRQRPVTPTPVSNLGHPLFIPVLVVECSGPMGLQSVHRQRLLAPWVEPRPIPVLVHLRLASVPPVAALRRQH